MVRDFIVEIRRQGTWETVADITDKAVRRWIKSLENPMILDALRVRVTRTLGYRRRPHRAFGYVFGRVKWLFCRPIPLLPAP